MWIKRDLEAILPKILNERPVLVLTGARQTGKTSLITKVFPKFQYVSLDLPSDAQQAELEPGKFLEDHPRPLVIDEIQNAPKIFRFIKHQVDQERQKMGQFILTGSHNFLLMKGISDSLAGRSEILELEPLSVSEIKKAYPRITLEEMIIRGGYPELYENIELDPTRFHRSYLATYLERDLRSALKVSQLRDFERFIRACALRTGQILNKSDLARDIGISPSTANEWISVLQASNQVALLEPWFSNQTKSLVKSPKMYLCDTGMLLFLLNIKTKKELYDSPLAGHIWESFVYLELRKNLKIHSEEGSLFFWNDRVKEVDFLIHKGGKFDLIEAKWTETPSRQDTEGILHATQSLTPSRIQTKRIVCRTSKAFPLPTGIMVEPVT